MKFTFFLGLLTSATFASEVTLLTLPDSGVQPQALVDNKGVLHVVFLTGKPESSEVMHATFDVASNSFSKPTRVNTVKGSAIKIGSIRGAQCAMGRGDRLHIVWNGNQMTDDGKRSMNVFYTRSTPDGGFEPERPLMQQGKFLDGGATVAADNEGHVYAMWHAAPLEAQSAKGELARRVYVSTSADDGQTFGKEEPCNNASTGVCGCCSMRAMALPTGEVYALYRAADGTGRGIQTLRSVDQGRSFLSDELQPWQVNACPMSSSFILPTPTGPMAAWETESSIWMTALSKDKTKPRKVSGNDSKHPSLAENDRGEVLITWAEGTGWQRGGHLAYRLLKRDGQDIGTSRSTPLSPTDAKVPVWSFPAAAFVPKLGFVIVH